MKKILLLPILIASMLSTSSCEKSDNPTTVQQDILYELYPYATNVEWDRERNGYIVADFYNQGLDTEVWFKGSAWHHTEIASSYMMLPDAVKDGILNSAYRGWYVEDVDLLKFPDDRADEYLIEVELGEKERDLYFTLDGRLL